MTRRSISLDVKFPALMTGLMLVSSAVFVWFGHRELTRVLLESAGERLRANGRVVAELLGAGMAPADQSMRALVAERDIGAAARALPPDPARQAMRIVALDGASQTLVGSIADAPGARWVAEAARRSALHPTRLTVSPLHAADSVTYFDLAFPIHARAGGESLTGWLVDTRRVQGQGAAAVRQLADSATILVGSLDEGVWTDLERVVAGPPPSVAPGVPVVFDDPVHGAGVGIATPVAGTPLVAWLARDRDAILAPLDAFLIGVAPIAFVLTLLVAIIVWRVSRQTTHRVVELTERVDRMDADMPAGAREHSAAGDEIDRLTRSFDAMFERARRERQLEEQLQQAQRLEAVGRLAGGVAHDFNNVLTVISNYSAFLRADAPEGSQTAEDLDQVLRASDRAARLTRQLLAFSRRQILQPEQLDLNAIVRESHSMLRRLIPTSIAIETDLTESLAPILADAVQIEQVLLNLAVNAADAMPKGGHLVFRTLLGELDADASSTAPETRQYACLVVRDDGIGMDRATVARIFEPFFTTKGEGKGTGLGLSTVHGIVTQLGGRVWVYSEPGHGTTFKVYLPLATEAPPTPRRSNPHAAVRAMAAGEVLLVEDDEATREVTARMLRDRGYVVRTAHDGASALLALSAGPLPHVVVSDLMMPGVDGAELAQHISSRWPGLPVVIMSGYADVELATSALDAVMVEKPFTARGLVDAIARALARSSARPEAGNEG